MPNFDINIDEKFGEIEEKRGIPKQRLYEVYNKILARVKKILDFPIERQKRIAYLRLRFAIKAGYPISFCPLCPYHTRDIREFQRHLKNKHNRGKGDLDRVRKGFWTARAKKRLDYSPKLP